MKQEDYDTPQKRKEVYEQVLEVFEHGRPSYGICAEIGEIARDSTATVALNLSRNWFPELSKQKPPDKGNFQLWWEPENKTRRIDALKSAIKLCEQ